MINNTKSKKFYNYLINVFSDAYGGFTLIELLVVMLIIGILGSIALPSFLSQTNKAKETEAKLYINTLTQAQQAHRVTYNSFASTVKDLNASVPDETDYYKYTVSVNEGRSIIAAIPKDDTLRAVSSKVFPLTNKVGDTEIASVTCTSTNDEPILMADVNNTSECPK